MSGYQNKCYHKANFCLFRVAFNKVVFQLNYHIVKLKMSSSVEGKESNNSVDRLALERPLWEKGFTAVLESLLHNALKLNFAAL